MRQQDHIRNSWRAVSVALAILLAALSGLSTHIRHVTAATPMVALRVVHGLRLTYALSIYANGLKLFTSVEPTTATDYMEIPAGTYHIKAKLLGASPSDVALVEVAARLMPNQVYTVILNEDPDQTMLLRDDNTWPDPLHVRVRWVNLTGDEADASAGAPTTPKDTNKASAAPHIHPSSPTRLASRNISPYLVYDRATFTGAITDPDQRLTPLHLDTREWLGGAVYTVYIFGTDNGFSAAISIDARALLLPETGEMLEGPAPQAFIPRFVIKPSFFSEVRP
ncbi:MAG: DUF4397 domain-containing protein [Anaerolineae bacterium]|nr:DUF4397 domain-containing protein [Anaerolineae bacterium]